MKCRNPGNTETKRNSETNHAEQIWTRCQETCLQDLLELLENLECDSCTCDWTLAHETLVHVTGLLYM